MVVAATVAVGLAGCSSGGGHKPSPSPTHTRSEAELRAQAEAELTKSSQVKMHWTGVMKGREKTSSSKVGLADGKPYVLEAACAGTGGVDFFWFTKTPRNDGKPELLCGKAPIRFPFTGGELWGFSFVPAGIDPPHGVLSWQIIPRPS